MRNAGVRRTANDPAGRPQDLETLALAQVAELEAALARSEAAANKRRAWLQEHCDATPPPGMPIRTGRA
jgi:hypothetical protein